MRDDLALLLLAALAIVATAGYRFRIELPPSRTAAAGFLAGTILWGFALFGVWYAWSQAQPGCGASCEDYTAVIGEELDSLSNQP
ncbi:MAG: hypothetical protein IH609_12040 [Dehalococcoidia bacterium]|nr:hypothetical protein [Dehalococcoidia bacterium]